MTVELAEQRYGKSRVRVLRLARVGGRSDIDDWTVEVVLEGGPAAVYADGDNTGVLPTDTMKNVVQVRARESTARCAEEFAEELAAELLRRSQTSVAVEVRIASALWKRLEVDGADDPASFMHGSNEQATVRLRQERGGAARLWAGLEDMVVIKTTQSGFAGFLRDDLTTLPDTDDRLLGTAVRAEWEYTRRPNDCTASRRCVREAILRTFALHNSRSVQHTLYAMAEAALEAADEIDAIDLTLPNRHYLLAELGRLGRDNPNRVFVPIDEPHGTIWARVRRKAAEA